MHPSVSEMWDRYRVRDAKAPAAPPISYCFSDNTQEADELLGLILSGRKRATAPSVAELQLAGDPIPQPGDFAIVTDWSGAARAIIRTSVVDIRRFGDVDEEFARIEGEGDLTLSWWRAAHQGYYTRVLAGTDHVVNEDLQVVCEQFELVFSG